MLASCCQLGFHGDNFFNYSEKVTFTGKNSITLCQKNYPQGDLNVSSLVIVSLSVIAHIAKYNLFGDYLKF